MKRVVIEVFMVLAAAAGGFYGGMYTYQKLLDPYWSTSFLDRAKYELLDSFFVVRDLDRGKTGGAKHSLNLRIDTSVIEIDRFLPLESSPEKQMAARRLLAMVARHRRRYPPGPGFSDNEVREALERAVREVEKAKKPKR